MQRRPRILVAFILASLSVLLGLSLESCKKSSTEPPPSIDSTSHMITWRTDTVAAVGFVNDLAIIDENNIWAAGEYYLRDSTGRVDPVMYNVMRWDGLKWNPMRLTFDYQGTNYLRQANAAIAFSATDIWLASLSPRHWDGQKLNSVDLGGALKGDVLKFWGTSSSNLYAVGSHGTLAHYDGTRFTAVPTGGVQSYFNDVTGRGEDEVYVGSYYYDNQIRPSGVFSYRTGGTLTFLGPDASESSPYQSLRDAFGLWVSPKEGTLWSTGGGFLFQPLKSHAPLPGVNPAHYALWAIRGLSDKDVWAAGSYSTVVHFNGASWRQYTEGELGSAGLSVEYRTVAVKGNIVVIGGWSVDPKVYPTITLGHRLM